MAGASIGTAYLTLTPTMKGTAAAVKKEFGLVEAEVDKSADRSGKSWLSKVGGGFGKVAKIGIGAIAGIGAAVGGLALAGGINRALAVEDARASLAGLGNDTGKIDTIMKDALASVKGTAFGLGDAAGVAASAVAAGIAPGQELERVLRLTADAATIAKTDMGDMGAIFNKVAATGKLNGEVVQQLGERGIPVLSGLAKMYGVTAEEASKMVSDGKVSFADFTTVMESTLGGAALKSGETFRGSMANMFAAFSRAGESIFAPLMPTIKTGMQSITSVMDSLSPVFKTAGEGIGAFFAPLAPLFADLASKAAPFIEKLMGAGPPPLFIVLGEVLKQILPALTDIGDVLGGVIIDLFKTLAPVAAKLGETLGKVLAAVLPIVARLLEALAPIFMQIVTALMPIVDALLPVLLIALEALMPIITALMPILDVVSTIITALAPIIAILAEFIGVVLTAAIGLLTPILDALVVVLTWLADLIGVILVPVIDWLVGVFDIWYGTIGDLISLVVAQMGPELERIFAGIGSFFNDVWNNVLKPVFDFFGMAWIGAQLVAQDVGNVLGVIFRGIGTALSWVWNNILSPVFNAIGGAFNWIGAVASSVGSWIGGIFTGIGAGFRGVANWAIDAINGLIRSLNSFSLKIPDWVPGFGGQKWGFNLGYVPRLAEGATVLPKPGGTLAVLAEAGKAESVVDAGLPNRVLEAAIAAVEDGGGSGDGVNLGSGNHFGYTVEELLDELEKRQRKARALGRK